MISGEPGTEASGHQHYIRCDYTASDGLEGAPVLKDGLVVGVHYMTQGTSGIRLASSVLSVRSTLQEWLKLGDVSTSLVRNLS